MKRRPHRPPSRIRYEEENPTVSARVPREIYNTLQEMKREGGLSVADFLFAGLDIAEHDVRQAFANGKREGARESTLKFRVAYRCSVCGGTIHVTSDGEKAAIASFMRGAGWGHAQCARGG